MDDLKDQEGLRPTRKVSAAGAGAAVVLLATWGLELVDVELTGEAGAALATLLALVFGYFTRERKETKDAG